MIGTYLQGGLGNYMFQIAAAHSLAIDNNTDSIFSINNFMKVHKHLSEYTDNIFRFVNFGPNVRYFRAYNEVGFDYSPIPFVENLLLRGYFQSEKYFKHNREQILSMFSPTEEEINYIEGKYGDLLSNETCSIHIRRGDYLKLQAHHPVCSMEYYNEAINRMTGVTHFLIFSDDIEWCKANFVGDEYVFIENEKDVIDLHMMSLCKNNIIANSSFSWWGAWLNRNENKLVITPSKWFGPAKANFNTKDIYPEEWVKI